MNGESRLLFILKQNLREIMKFDHLVNLQLKKGTNLMNALSNGEIPIFISNCFQFKPINEDQLV